MDATVTVQVHDDGSGTVTARLVLDPEAVRAAETSVVKLEDAVRLGDLEAAGWETSGWERREERRREDRSGKDFDRAEDAAEVVDELNGPDGPLQRHRGGARRVDVQHAVVVLRGRPISTS